MNHEQFINLVKEMRDTQKDFFKNRHVAVLLEAKELEKLVDYNVSMFLSKQMELDLEDNNADTQG